MNERPVVRAENRKLLEPYACLLARVHQRIQDMNDGELDKLDAAVKDASRTNCWYAVYEVARLLEPQIAVERLMRRNRKTRAL